MESPRVVRVVSRSERLAEAEKLVSQAEAEMVPFFDNLDPQGSINAFFTYMQALSIFENAGDLNDPRFKAKLAGCWERCAITIGRVCDNGDNASKVLLGMEALNYRVYKRAVELHGELVGELRTNKQLRTAWKQLLFLHNLGLWAMKAGELSYAELIWLQNIELQTRFDIANDNGVHNPRDWLEPHFHLAFVRQKLGRSDKEVLATIDAGLAGFEPAKCVSPHALEFCHHLSHLKSEILHAQFMKKWEASERRKKLKDSKLADSCSEG